MSTAFALYGTVDGGLHWELLGAETDTVSSSLSGTYMWTQTLVSFTDGETVIPKEYSGKFYTISLNEGINTIEMAYEPDFIGTMALISLLSLVLLVLFVFIENYYDMHYPER